VGVRRRDWDGLAFRCHDCGIGFSNSTNPDARVRIVRTPQQAVPEEVQAGLDDALAHAFNVRNRPSKRNAFCSASSEDAVTWTVFNGLALAGRLPAVLEAAGLADHDANGPLTVLLWGVPVAGPTAEPVRAALLAVSDALGETPASRSEPDVILVADTLVMFIEAKTHSRNECDRDAAGWPLYLGDESRFTGPVEDVQKAGYYELARNWVIGNDLADALGRDFALLNLGPQKLAKTAREFAALTATTPHRAFGHLRWAELLDAAMPLPTWLEAYAGHGMLLDL
jgi:hypothetical protein